jgi:hypothetical protein
MMTHVKVMFHGRLALCVLCLFLFSGCGKKGNPTMKSFEKPAAVANMSAIHRDGKVTIAWSYPKQAKITIKGFYVERAEEERPFENLAFLKGEVSQYSDEHFKTGEQYRYRIRVYSMRDIIGDDSPEIEVAPVRLPDPPRMMAYGLTDDALEIKWNEVPGASYNIYRSTEKGKYPGAPLNARPLDKPFFSDRIETGMPVFYAVRAIVQSNIRNEGDPSADLEVNPQSFIPTRPTDLRYVRSEDRGYLSWKENSETWVKGYKVYRRSATGEYLPAGEAAIPLFVDEVPVTAPTSYYVTSLGPVKESQPSEMMSVNP